MKSRYTVKLQSHWGIFFTAIFFIMASTISCSSSKRNSLKTNPSWVIANWQGSAYQFDTKENWTMTLAVDSLTNDFKIDYPSLQCSGNWKVIRISENRIELREKITRGIRNCVTRGKVVLEHRSDHTAFRYYYPTDTFLNAEGHLFRVPSTINE